MSISDQVIDGKAQTTRPSVSSSAPHVVIIDDDVELLNLVAMLLRRVNANTHTFFHGTSALEYLEGHTPDLIILDLMLPEPSGVAILSKIRATPRMARVPVLILSAKNDPATIRQGLDAGADGYLTKPYVAHGLVERVRLLLNGGRPQGSVQGTAPGDD